MPPSSRDSPSRCGVWRRPIELAASAPFRLCLRLEEPKPGPQREHDQWRVGYLLQAMDDQSLLVPVKSAWKASGHEAVVLNRDGFRPASICFLRWGRPRRSVRGSSRASKRRHRRVIRSTRAVRTSFSRSAPRRSSRRVSAYSCLRGGHARGRSCGSRLGRLCTHRHRR